MGDAAGVFEAVQLPLTRACEQTELIAELAARWEKLRPGGLLPSIADFGLDPSNAHVGSLVLLKPGLGEAEPAETAIWALRLNLDPPSPWRRLRAADLSVPEWRASVLQEYVTVTGTGVPARHLLLVQDADLRFQGQRLLLPFAADGRVVSDLLIVLSFRIIPEPFRA